LRAIVAFDLLNHTLPWVALDHWFLGYPEQAREYSNQALAVAVEQGDPHGQAFASAIGSITLFLLRGDAAVVQHGRTLCPVGRPHRRAGATPRCRWRASCQAGGSIHACICLSSTASLRP
jgi:hypothetical protein